MCEVIIPFCVVIIAAAVAGSWPPATLTPESAITSTVAAAIINVTAAKGDISFGAMCVRVGARHPLELLAAVHLPVAAGHACVEDSACASTRRHEEPRDYEY